MTITKTNFTHGSDSGPACPSCGSRIYGYLNTHESLGNWECDYVAQAICIGCHATTRWPHFTDCRDARDFRFEHEAHADAAYHAQRQPIHGIR